jgi:DNA-binding response OmpR family regulator
MKALIVDDDLALADVVSFTMRRAGFEVITAYDGRSALQSWKAEAPDVVILDLNLPKLDGMSVCQQIHAEDDTPIVILSVRGEEEDIVRGLELGADDYVVKPFSPRQLVARVEAVLRRANNHIINPEPLFASDLVLEPSRQEVSRNGQVIAHLTRLESRLLEVLMRNSGQVLPADNLIDHVWGSNGGDRGMLKQLVYRLRHKIEHDPSNPEYLETVSGVGYTFCYQFGTPI